MDTSAKHHCITDPAAVAWLDELQRANATLRAQLAEAQEREEIKDAAIAKALAIHDRYCDRVGVADSSWASTVHAALRGAAALALAATRGRGEK